MCESSDEEICPSLSEYFLASVKKLCLDDFPHGFGKWRLSPGDMSKDVRRASDELRMRYEQADELVDLIKDSHSPWSCSDTWSEDICSLKEIAVKHPRALLRRNFIWEHFRNLTFVDKNISLVDVEAKKLVNLDRLTLSVNSIQTLDVDHLPACLRHLELYGNRIENISKSQSSATVLFYLGLGGNCLSNVLEYFSRQLWPCLIMLDLCLNDLLDLHNLCAQLKELCNLRSLVAYGNPLSFVPVYRYYIIDTIKQLSHVDGRPVNALERARATGLKFKECTDPDLQEGKILVQIAAIKGFPEQTEPSDSQKKKCFVRYSFVDGCSSAHADPGNIRPPDESCEVIYQPGDVYTTYCHDWREIVEVNEFKIIAFSDLKLLKKCLCGNLKIEIFEATVALPSESFEAEKRSPPVKKKSTPSAVQVNESAEDETKGKEDEIDVRLLRIFSLPLGGLLGDGQQELNLQLTKQILLETSKTRKSSRPEVRQSKSQKIKDKAIKTSTSANVEPRNVVVSATLEVNLRVAISRSY